ncbi:6017_t:CDS:1, partial [Acaulospora colombiana]
MRTIKRNNYTANGTSIGPERLLFEYIALPDNHLVIVEDPTAPMRADHLADYSSITTRNAAKKATGASDSELEREPPTPAHYRHTLISFKLHLMPTLLDQLGGAWSTQVAKSTVAPLMGKPSGGITHRLRIEGVVWSVGSDWI